MVEISIIGFGPGDWSFLTQAALKEIHSADIIIGTRHQLELIPRSTAMCFKVPQRDKTIEETITGLVLGNRYRRVVFLTEGDPGIMSIAPALIEMFGQRVRIIPGISLIQTAFARLGLSWFGIVMAKARSPRFRINRSHVLTSGRLFVYLGDASCVEGVFKFFKSLNQGWRMFVFENLTLPNEKIYEVLQQDACVQILNKAVVVLFDSACSHPREQGHA